MSCPGEHFGFVVGNDSHAQTHTLAIVKTATDEEIANEAFAATAAGSNRALSWILRRTGGSAEEVLLSMEGTGSYGAKLRQQAAEAGFQVTEAPVPNHRLGRYQGKSDALDATRAAREPPHSCGLSTLASMHTISGWLERDEEPGVQTCRREASRLAKQILACRSNW